jgi:hypothetical protein
VECRGGPGSEKGTFVAGKCRERHALRDDHPRTVGKLVGRGAIPALEVGGDRRFPKKERDYPAVIGREQLGAGRCTLRLIDDRGGIGRELTGIAEPFGCLVRQALSGAKGSGLLAPDVPDQL